MAFKSAELKRLVEQLWAAGYAISASRAARLFSQGELAALVESVVGEQTQQRQLEEALEAAMRESKYLAWKHDSYQKGLQQAQEQVVFASRRYLELQREIDQLKASLPDMEELQRRAKYYRSMIASLDYQIMQPGTSGDYLTQLQSLRAQMFANLDKVEKEIGENQAKWNEIKAKETLRDRWGYLAEMYRRYTTIFTERAEETGDKLHKVQGKISALQEELRSREKIHKAPINRIIV